jgi:hypothetical protein
LIGLKIDQRSVTLQAGFLVPNLLLSLLNVHVLTRNETAEDVLAYQFDQQGNWKINLIEWGTPEKSMDNEQFWLVFNDCLSRLPQRMADLLLLRAVDGLETEECCALLGFDTDNQLWVTYSAVSFTWRIFLAMRCFALSDNWQFSVGTCPSNAPNALFINCNCCA